ncbi:MULTISPECIES: Rieske 2Fe-2S domain-containing protein [Pseudonocardia]|uniref:Nitrite reductase (NADH) small subunit n=1 Tax=Pseudonocardia oroxyli TaxID=366584 RepID=A0A1G7G308_PSEOR|nr:MULTISPECIES: Rieske 2Fe-2S domain-containing protein [Pseudonocardia]MCF7552975.1 Rieske 2Fe-2S domain-containing protein [Pseudonocardia sp. WMMC193]SDE82522.1 nitrite reductase (NADH) small subunit [Pseudonocardia oroxyli]
MSEIRTEEWVATVPLADLARRRKTRVEIGDRAVALFLVGERVFALDDVCIHKGRSLSRGVLWQGSVVCPAHQWKFDPETGAAEDRDECQPVHAVRVVDGIVHVSAQPR